MAVIMMDEGTMNEGTTSSSNFGDGPVVTTTTDKNEPLSLSLATFSQGDTLPDDATSDVVSSVIEGTDTDQIKEEDKKDVGMLVGETTTMKKKKKPPPRRIVRRQRNGSSSSTTPSHTIDPILLEKTLASSNLPSAYSFEIVKTVQRIHTLQATHVALQMPEGLLLYATVIADVLQRLCTSVPLQQVSVLGDVTYGACCVDDLGAAALGCTLLVHYGHSCLVPIQHTAIPCLYVFVEITIDVPHLVQCLHLTLNGDEQQRNNSVSNNGGVQQRRRWQPHIYLLGTIQFRHALVEAKGLLESDMYGPYETSIPQAKPLSPGEVLGCTSPVLADNKNNGSTNSPQTAPTAGSIVLFIADGRFHLESTMISNPHIDKFYRYDPYSKTLTEESYQHDKMKAIRYDAIQKAKSARVFGILLGTLGRQGNPAILSKIQAKLKETSLKEQQQENLNRQNQPRRSFVMLVSEITPAKLALFGGKVDAWVQIACPRLSVDWGHYLSNTGKPVLNPYEFFVCMDEVETPWRERYPMDYYSNEGGPWANYHSETKARKLTTSV